MNTLRHQLHALAERSSQEHQTAALVASELEKCKPAKLLTNLGTESCHTGIAALFNPDTSSLSPIALRAELDALPIPESTDLTHASKDPTTSHRCGHDGHTAALLLLAHSFKINPPPRPVILLFQPAEETGHGALAMLQDPQFQQFWKDHTPARTLAVHNAPGLPLGTIALRNGPICSATTALTFHFEGTPSHAAEPQHAATPSHLLAQLIQKLATTTLDDDPASLITIAHAYLGEHQTISPPNFGMTPAHATLGLTLRAETTPNLRRLADLVKDIVQTATSAATFQITTTESDTFPENTNHPSAVDHARQAAKAASLQSLDLDLPFPFGEDFIHLVNATPNQDGALIGIGSGTNHPRLHTLGYDWPDDLTQSLVSFWQAIVQHA